MTTSDRGPAIWTARGYFYPFDPRPEEVHLEVIAAALSKVCRWGGHTPQFLSVAQHSVYCAEAGLRVSRETARAALLHDAAEAYIGDMVRPLKARLVEFSVIEGMLLSVIMDRFEVDVPSVWADVLQIDEEVLAAEKAAMFPEAPEWGLPAPADIEVNGWVPIIAQERFLALATELDIR